MSQPIVSPAPSVPAPRRADVPIVTTVDLILSVDPYDPAVPALVGVAVEDTAHGRHVLLTSCGGLKVEFRVPAANAGALCEAIRDAAGHGQVAA
jgi:hypothetical protein